MNKNQSNSSESQTRSELGTFNQALIFMDDLTWIWELTQKALQKDSHTYTKVLSNMSIRPSWERFKTAPFLLLHWENKLRSGGAIVEEILDIDPSFDIGHKLIVITTNPIHEDVVFFAELGIHKVVRPRQRESEMREAAIEIQQHISRILTPNTKPSTEDFWRKIMLTIEKLPENPSEQIVSKIQENIAKLIEKDAPKTARELEALATIQIKSKQFATAEDLLNQALEINPNYFRAWNKLIDVKRNLVAHQEAYALLQKMQMHNRRSIKRLVAMGEEQLALHDKQKAEYYFMSALDKDNWCAGALNGLAELKFDADDLDEARRLLTKSNLAYKFAGKLNLHGIELVRQSLFEKALNHYNKAQYVLPLQEKGPQLLYNIALCYAKWERFAMAEEFLKLAIIKEPNYKKALSTLNQIRSRPESASVEDLDVA